MPSLKKDPISSNYTFTTQTTKICSLNSDGRKLLAFKNLINQRTSHVAALTIFVLIFNKHSKWGKIWHQDKQ